MGLITPGGGVFGGGVGPLAVLGLGWSRLTITIRGLELGSVERGKVTLETLFVRTLRAPWGVRAHLRA